MKIKRTVISISVAILIIASLCASALLLGACTDNDFKAYHDKEIYIQQKYHDREEFGEQVYFSGVGVDYFMPKYEEIEYNYSDIDFYIYNGVGTLTKTAITFVLDLMFSDKDEYESAKQNELSTRTFMTEYEGKKPDENPVFEFNFGTFYCKTADGKGYPQYVMLICLDDSNCVLRYLVFQEWINRDEVKAPEYIVKCTNCPWNN